MRGLDAIAVFSTLLLCGNELAVSLFVNPALWRRDDQDLASELSRSLGRYMPFWYAFCLLLLGVEAYLHRNQAGRGLILTSLVLWAIIIVYTLTALVPINNRLASMTTPRSLPDWQQHSRRWDRLHRLRIGLLLVSIGLLYSGLSHGYAPATRVLIHAPSSLHPSESSSVQG